MRLAELDRDHAGEAQAWAECERLADELAQSLARMADEAQAEIEAFLFDPPAMGATS